MIRAVHSVEQLLESDAPASCYLADRFLCWGTPEGYGGHAVWGRPDGGSAERYVEVLEAILTRPDLHPRRIVADFRALDYVDAEAFGVVQGHIRRHREAIASLEIREAVLHPEGVVGSVVAGFYAVAPKPIESRAFDDVEAAFAWLGVPEGRAVFAEVERLQSEQAGADPLVSRLREVLAADQAMPLDDAARAIGASTRSLQRALTRVGTSFRAEQNGARLRRATTLLASEATLTEIAFALGFSSSQHFATWFRKQTGQAPSAWRRSRS